MADPFETIAVPENLMTIGQNAKQNSLLFTTVGYLDDTPPDDIIIPNHAEQIVDLILQQFKEPIT